MISWADTLPVASAQEPESEKNAAEKAAEFEACLDPIVEGPSKMKGLDLGL